MFWTSEDPKVVLTRVIPDTRSFIWTPEFYFFIFIGADWKAAFVFVSFIRAERSVDFYFGLKFRRGTEF